MEIACMLKQLNLLILTIFISFSIHAQDLTKQEIEQWLKASPTISTWLNNNKDALNDEQKIDFLTSSPAEVSAYATTVLKKHGLYNEFSTKLKQHGFTDLNRFFEVQTQLVQAYMAITVERSKLPSSMNQELLDALTELEQTEGLSSEQKTQLKNQMMNMMGQVMKLQDTNKNTADVNAIKPYYDQISKAFEDIQ